MAILKDTTVDPTGPEQPIRSRMESEPATVSPQQGHTSLTIWRHTPRQKGIALKSFTLRP